MRFIEKRKFGQDRDIEVPVFVINHAELKVLLAVLKKAKIYIPTALTGDMGRVNNMVNEIADYLRVQRYK